MKLSDQSLLRIARHLLSQQEPLQAPEDNQGEDYGDGNPTEVQSRLAAANAQWTDQGWVVPGSLDISYIGLTRLPLLASVDGDFYCYYNYLTTLEGSPRYVGGNMDCATNQLTTLEGSPDKIWGTFKCNNNKLTTLQGAPRQVGGDFNCKGNQLSSLDGIGKVGGEVVS